MQEHYEQIIRRLDNIEAKKCAFPTLPVSFVLMCAGVFQIVAVLVLAGVMLSLSDSGLISEDASVLMFFVGLAALCTVTLWPFAMPYRLADAFVARFEMRTRYVITGAGLLSHSLSRVDAGVSTFASELCTIATETPEQLAAFIHSHGSRYISAYREIQTLKKLVQDANP